MFNRLLKNILTVVLSLLLQVFSYPSHNFVKINHQFQCGLETLVVWNWKVQYFSNERIHNIIMLCMMMALLPFRFLCLWLGLGLGRSEIQSIDSGSGCGNKMGRNPFLPFLIVKGGSNTFLAIKSNASPWLSKEEVICRSASIFVSIDRTIRVVVENKTFASDISNFVFPKS